MSRNDWRRVAEVTAGALVLAIAFLALAALFALIYGAAQMSAVEGEDEAFWSGIRIARRLGYVGVLLLVAYVGLALLEGRQLCVLYLRRFRLNVNAISPTDAGGLGRRVRLFTLDDEEFTPSEVPRLDKWLTRLGPIAVLAIIVVASKTFTDTMLIGYSEDNEGNWFALVFFVAFSSGMLWFLLVVLLVHRFRLRRGATMRVRTVADIAHAAAAMRWASHWLLRPALVSRQATVIAVSADLWQQTVRALACCANAVVVDVTEYSKNLAWELNALAEERIEPAFIADYDHFDCSLDGGWTEERSKFGAVIGYRHSDRKQLKAFRRRVRETLFKIGRPTRKGTVVRELHVRRFASLALFYGTAFALAAVSAWIVGFIAIFPAFDKLVSH